MKNKLTYVLLVITMTISSFAMASFPVERNHSTATSTEVVVSDEDVTVTSPAAVAWSESQTIAILLWFFLKNTAY